MSSGVTPARSNASAPGADARRLREVLPFAHRGVGDRLAGAEDPHGCFGAIPGPLLAGEHEGAAAVGADATVELGQRVPHDARVHDVVDGDGVPVVGLRIEPRVVAGRHRDLGELLHGRAELVHVTAGHHGVMGADGVPEGRRELDRAPCPEGEVRHPELLLQVRSLRRAVGEHHHLDQTLGDGGDGVLDHELPDAAAVPRRVDPVGPQAEILGQLDRRERAGQRHEPVDLRLGDSRLRQRPLRALEVELERGLVVDPSAVRGGRSDDGDAASGHHARTILMVMMAIVPSKRPMGAPDR